MWSAMFIKMYLDVDSNVYQSIPRCGQQCLSKSTQVWTMFLYLYIQFLSKSTQMWTAMFIKTYLDVDSNVYQNVPRCGQQCLSKSTQMWTAMFIKTYLSVDSNVYQNIPRCGQQCLSKRTQVWTALFIKTYLDVDNVLIFVHSMFLMFLFPYCHQINVMKLLSTEHC